jgi:TatA/E family protein of Tat protein translocase
MFGPIGGSEFILLAAMALLLFGPRKLPQIGRSIGRALAEFRGATHEFKRGLEQEVAAEQVREAKESITDAGREIRQSVEEVTRPSVARGSIGCPDADATEQPDPDDESPTQS